MTTESYMNRFHGRCREEADPISAEDLYPCCRLEEAETCPCARESDPCPCGRAADPRPCPREEDDPIQEDGCCCKASMAAALRLLCGDELSQLVNFNSFFFLTDALTVGGTLNTTTGAPDNIAAAVGALQRFSPCNCDLIEVEGSAYHAVPSAPDLALLTVDTVSVCALKAAAFQLVEDQEEVTCECPSVERRALRLLRRAIRSAGGDTNACGVCQAHCDCDDCCCAAGILTELSGRNLSRQATLTVGPLVLQGVTVLGSLGTVLVLWNEAERRVYFVCANHIEVLG